MEHSELIEKYLQGLFTEKEKFDFEKMINADASLKEQVELQKAAMLGIQRYELKKQTQMASKKYRMKNNIKNWGLGIGIITVLSVMTYYVLKSYTNKSENQIKYELNENEEKLWSDADKRIQSQFFEIDPSKDTVIETNKGIVFSIPAHCFTDAKGEAAQANVTLEIKEAMDPASIITAGLSSKSGSKLLESEGMFYINARAGETSLKINPKNGIYAQIPTAHKKEGMLVFNGKRLSDGSIDWVAPGKMENFLIPRDIHSLNFYPPLYLDSLLRMGYDIKDKKFTDSLYYSFAGLFKNEPQVPAYEGDLKDTIFSKHQSFDAANGEKLFTQACRGCHFMDNYKLVGPGLKDVMNRVPQPAEKYLYEVIKNSQALLETPGEFGNYTRKIYKEYNKSVMPSMNLTKNEIEYIIEFMRMSGQQKGINPSKIRAIWNNEFDHTLIATKEFETRLQLMHSICNESIFDLYINNMDKNLCTIDSMAAKYDPKFYQFAALGEGRVQGNHKQLERLKIYFANKTKIYTEAIEKTNRDYKKKNQALRNKVIGKINEQSTKEALNAMENFNKEFKINLKEAYKQLGKPFADVPINTAYYATVIVSSGWKNVDAYVMESTIKRTTLNYTDTNGKKAVIKYEPITVIINDFNNYDKVMVYLLADSLNSFMRMKQNGNEFKESLNELFKYNLVCVAWKGEMKYHYIENKVQPGEHQKINLSQIEDKLLHQKLNDMSSVGKQAEIAEDLKFQEFLITEDKRNKVLSENEQLSKRIQNIIFPCFAAVAPASAAK